MGRDKDGFLRGRTALWGWDDLGPFINDLDFAMKEWTLGFIVGVCNNDIVLVQNGGAKDLVALFDTVDGFG